jgi:hypothetical protein
LLCWLACGFGTALLHLDEDAATKKPALRYMTIRNVAMYLVG